MKLSKKYKYYLKEMKKYDKYNKLKKLFNSHTQHHHKQKPSSSSSRVYKSPASMNNASSLVENVNINYKLPILTQIELVKESTSSLLLGGSGGESSSNNATNGHTSTTNVVVANETTLSPPTSSSSCSSSSSTTSSPISNNTSSNVLIFDDYLLLPSRTKFKYLVHSLFEQIKLDKAEKSKLRVVDGYLKVRNWQPISLNSIGSTAQCQIKRDKNSETASVMAPAELFSNPAALTSSENKAIDMQSNSEESKEVLNNGESKERGGEDKQQPIVRKSRKQVIKSHKRARSSSSSSLSLNESNNEEAGDEISKSINDHDEDDDDDDHDGQRSRRSSSSASSLSFSLSPSSSSDMSDDSMSNLSGFDDNNKRKKSNSHRIIKRNKASSQTVYDMLSHVVSFSTIIIRVRLRDDKCEFSLNNKLSSSQSHSTSKKPTSLAVSVAIADSTPVVATSKKQIIVPKNATESDSSLNSQQQQHQQSQQQQQQQLLQNQLTSNLYANSQLANLIPLFNLPILSQLMNGLKNNNNQLAQDMMTNLETNIINSTTSNINNNNNNNQPLNLTKDLTTNANNLTKQVSKKPAVQGGGSQITSASLNTNSNNNSMISKSQSSPSPSVSSTASSSTNQSHNANSSNNNSNNTGGLKIANLSSLQALTSPTASSAAQAQLTTQQKIEQLRNQASKLLAVGSASFGGSGVIGGHHSSSSRKQRERTTFDPHEEITRLMQIFERTHHPTRYQIANICDFLNGLACRKDKKPLEPYNIQYWFKNARAALRRKNKSISSADDPSGLLNSFNATANAASVAAGDADNEIIDQILRSKPSMSSSAAAFKTRDFMSNHRLGNSSGQMKLEQTGDLIDGYGDDMDEDGKYSDFDDDEDELSEDDEDFLNPNEEENGQYEASDYQLDHHVKSEISHNLHSELDSIQSGSNATVTSALANTNRQSSNLLSNLKQEDSNQPDNDDDELNNYDYQDDNLSYEDDEDGMNGNSESLGMSGGAGGGNASFKKMLGSSVKHQGGGGGGVSRRNRVFIDPITEVPILEHYFSIETYPDHYLIEKICDILNNGEYRSKFPKLESRNIQLWFKNHRAKLKRVVKPGSN